MIGLVDCNNFYASCERVFQPWYNGRPVVVLSNNDGCVIARSAEAKELKIPMGAVAHEWEKFFEEHNVIVFSSNYTLYGDMSLRVMNTLWQFCEDVEVYSIDEGFMDLGTFGRYDLTEYAMEIKATVGQCTGIPVGIGIGKSKSLAKAANKYAKKVHRDKGVFVIDSEEKREEVLRWLPLEDIWGVGRANNQYFGIQHGVKTAWEFSQLNKEFVRKKMGVVGVRLVEELNGLPCIDLELMRPKKQNICTSRSFPTSIGDKYVVSQAVGTFVSRCAEKLRKEGSCARIVTVFLQTNPYRQDHKQYSNSATFKLVVPASGTIELLDVAMEAFEEIWKDEYLYKKAGVIVNGLVPEDQIQADLFHKVDRERETKLMKALDDINGKMGQDRVRLGRAGYDKQWRSRCERLSKHFTTDIGQLIKVSAK